MTRHLRHALVCTPGATGNRKTGSQQCWIMRRMGSMPRRRDLISASRRDAAKIARHFSAVIMRRG